MRTSTRLALLILLIAAAWPSAFAGNNDIEIHSVPKKLDSNVVKATDGGANRTVEHWVYEITIENKTFHDLTGMEAKYTILYTHEQLGVKLAPTPKRANGTLPIDSLKAHEKKTITTEPVELDKSNLVGNWIYRSGAKPNAQDSLVGLALHLNQGGQLFAQYANPPNLSGEKVD
jgi:hypothetical protein